MNLRRQVYENSIVEFIGQHDVRCINLYIFSGNSWKKEIQTAILYNTSHICMQLYYLCSHYIYFNW